MSKRRLIRVDLKDGSVSVDETTTTAETFSERVSGMAASLGEHMVGDGVRCEVICDGCGARVEIDVEHPELPAGWRTLTRRTLPDGDYCADCCEG